MKYWQKKALENFKRWVNETPREELIKQLDNYDHHATQHTQ